jgi:CspA family cold shock protein
MRSHGYPAKAVKPCHPVQPDPFDAARACLVGARFFGRRFSMPSGVVKWFDSKKGFGFIDGGKDGKDVFVHYTSIEGEGFRSLKDGDVVEYDIVDSERGPQARNVRRTDTKAALS